MNPGKLNHRIKFSLETSTVDQFGGVSVVSHPVVCSDTVPTDTTWGSLEPMSNRSAYNQLFVELGATVFNLSKMLAIRWRKSFTPTKAMIFEDLNNPGDIYTVHAIMPYYPSVKTTMVSNDQKPFKDQVFILIVGIKRV